MPSRYLNHRTLLLPAVLVSLLTGCGDDPTGPTDQVEPRIEFVALDRPVDLTPDGRMAAIQDGASPTGDLYFYHVNTRLLEFKTQVGDPLRTFATAMSATGTVTALHGEPVQAGFWTSASEWTDLASSYKYGCDQDLAGAWDVSANGQSVVGLVWNRCNPEAFIWDASGSGIMTPLQVLGESWPGSSNPPSNRATVVSDDGSVVAGWAQTSMVDRWPAVWGRDGTGELLTSSKSPDTPGEVLSISDDGRVLAGTWGADAFYWTASTGTVIIGQLPGADPFFDPTFANAIAVGGKLIFGGSGNPFFTTPRAFVWTTGGGMRPLQDVVTAAGVSIPEGYLLTNVLAASTDGTVVLGTAYASNFSQVTFVLHLPVTAYGL